jgi:hypothetical protein
MYRELNDVRSQGFQVRLRVLRVRAWNIQGVHDVALPEDRMS